MVSASRSSTGLPPSIGASAHGPAFRTAAAVRCSGRPPSPGDQSTRNVAARPPYVRHASASRRAGHAEHSPCHAAAALARAAPSSGPRRSAAQFRVHDDERRAVVAGVADEQLDAPRRVGQALVGVDTAGRGTDSMIGPNGRRPTSPNRAAAAAAAVWASSSCPVVAVLAAARIAAVISVRATIAGLRAVRSA